MPKPSTHFGMQNHKPNTKNLQKMPKPKPNILRTSNLLPRVSLMCLSIFRWPVMLSEDAPENAAEPPSPTLVAALSKARQPLPGARDALRLKRPAARLNVGSDLNAKTGYSDTLGKLRIHLGADKSYMHTLLMVQYICKCTA